jgi:LPXTG-site transpeptidase (sortase) family protein
VTDILSSRRRLLVATLAGGLFFPAMQWRVGLAQEEPAVPAGGPAADDEPVAASGMVVSNGVPPVALAIPKLAVDAPVVGVGQDPDGTMSAPSDPDTVAWYTLGPGMGIGGNVVFAGHVDWDGRHRVFAGLTRLEPGDAVLIVDEHGDGYEYKVESSYWVKADGAPIKEIFAQTDESKVTLITCGGDFNASRREYLERLIVTAKGA